MSFSRNSPVPRDALVRFAADDQAAAAVSRRDHGLVQEKGS